MIKWDKPCYKCLSYFCDLSCKEPEHLKATQQKQEPVKLWLWKNFVDGRPEYWAFDNAFPINLDDGDPQTIGEPCGYAWLKPSRQGRFDVDDEKVLRAIKNAKESQPQRQPLTDKEILDAFCLSPELTQAFRAGVRFAEDVHGIKL